MKKFLLAFAAAATFAACSSGPGKKVLVMAKGSVTAEGNNITVKEGTGYAEKELELSGSEKTTLTVKNGSNTTTVDVPAAGAYILNLRVDSVVGSKLELGKDLSSNKMISQQELKVKIDSLKQLSHGLNVSAANQNYLAAPGALVKISENPKARLYGPYHKIPAALEPGEDGKAPEIYKFYSGAEFTDLINNLEKMTH
ncbi:hypothetical protein [Deminuibacter soli]|uniref:Lipoprotein n=1 Tax=Deminuibacter soli TaxID=2291815 RepID=A0A3E1NRF0_9BACT|nr:hypothetical protein [Deminuibacter soli]RFM30495.1 hypothetical protein DXN05_05940 [Deminuibacter soli]